MLIVREVHRVAGASEHEFEAAFRDRWLPELAAGDDARLLAYLHLAHGTGRAYEVVTFTAVRDGAAYERLVERVRDGDLRAWAADVDRPPPRRRRDDPRDRAVGAAGRRRPVRDPDDLAPHPLTVFMEDTARPHEGKVDAYLDAARDHYAPSLAEGRHGGRAMLTLETVWQTAWGGGPASGRRALAAGARPRVARPAHRLGDPRRAPGPRHVDARRARGPRRLAEPPAAHQLLVAAPLAGRLGRAAPTSERAG